MKVRYIGTLAQRIGRIEDEVSPDADVISGQDLIAWLRRNDEALNYALSLRRNLTFAVDGIVRPFSTDIRSANQVALIDPISGG
jgi:molybdopterin synthase sulfur carrier subunit